jgi:high-affinity iron transporter
MKTVFIFILAGGAIAHAADSPAGPSPVEKLAGLVDYLAADYPGAVKDGQVIAPDEYAEQRGLLDEAKRLAPPGDALHAELDAVDRAFAQKASERELGAACQKVHKRLVDDYGLTLAPTAPPDAARAREVYAIACASCHGATGHGDGPKAKELKPPPVDFFDGERMSRISPQLAFHALTFGVANTGMASFETLPPSDRWSLAFHVVGLRHEADAKKGEAALRASGVELATTASRLAELSDAQLTEKLAALSPADREAAIAWLRRDASFAAAPGGRFAEARRLLAAVGAAADDRPRARSLAIEAYLNGIEPHEAALKAHDRPLADRIERAFLDLRRVIETGAAPDAVRREVARCTLVLDAADEQQRAGRSVPFLAALTIALREGFELSLLVAALLAFVRKSGHTDYARYIHLGWLAAVPAGAASWFLVGAVLQGARRELTEGILTLVAAAMLLFVSHFVLGKMESRKWLKFLERKTRAAAESQGAIPWPLVAVAFVAAFREAIEIVLFFRALALDAPGAGWAIAGGAASGIAILIVLVQVMARLGRRLDPRPVMMVSSLVLTVIAISLVGQGVRALQEGGYVHLAPLPPSVSVPLLGIYPSVEGVVAQLVVLALVVVPAWLDKRKTTPNAHAAAK